MGLKDSVESAVKRTKRRKDRPAFVRRGKEKEKRAEKRKNPGRMVGIVTD